MTELDRIINSLPQNKTILDNMVIAYSKINSPLYKKIVCTVSGGSDSDIVMDICTKCDISNKITYVWFDTGIEFAATKRHLDYLEQRYGIRIERERARKNVPQACREYGVPFLSKAISENIERLQKHGFRWEDKPYEQLLQEYCIWKEAKQDYVGCKSALRWWCNEWGEDSQLNISRRKYLKEFLIENPPNNIVISAMCCEWAKKKIIHQIINDGEYDLNINGVRKYEGGKRSTILKSCFSENDDGCDVYRPIFFYKNQDKQDYEEHYKIVHSDCYTVYGLRRTGCAACPFGQKLDHELRVLKEHEPKLYKAVCNIFRKSYEYTTQYKEFASRKEGKR